MRKMLAALVVALAVPCVAQSAGWQDPRPGFSENDVPSALKPWVPWVMADAQVNRCPFLYNNEQERHCVWPGELSLRLGASGGEFTLHATLYDEAYLELPGSEGRWPQHVKANGVPVAVMDKDGVPQLFLQAGSYTVSGGFEWRSLPESLRLPEGNGIVKLELGGREAAFPDIENQMVWIKGREVESAEENRVDIKVFRRIVDSIPLIVETRLRLHVSGKHREALLGSVLLAGFVPMDVQSELPARIEPDGHLRMQLRPGVWDVSVKARHDTPVAELALPRYDEAKSLAREEIWVFEPQSHLRVTQVEGMAPIDPAQTGLPQEWRQFPAYYAPAGSLMKIVEKMRGDAEPRPDRLSLSKEWWLDFDGRGFTMRDRIDGDISRSWRLDAADGVTLGRVAIHGRDQFITTLAGAAKPGVEVRPGPLSLEADSRIENVRSVLPATGWEHGFQAVQGTLNLPPGWSLMHVSGADSVSQSWVQRWSLLDVFMVLMAAIVMHRLFGLSTAGVAGVGLALLHHEMPGLTGAVLTILGVIALLRALPEGRFRTFAQRMRTVLLLCLVVSALPFMAGHLRGAMFPQLVFYASGGAEQRRAATSVDNVAQKQEMQEGMVASVASSVASDVSVATGKRVMADSAAQEIYQYAPDMQAGTGAGVSDWTGSQITVRWNGPVAAHQELRLWLLSPEVNLLLALARVALLGALLLFLCGAPPARETLARVRGMVARALGGVAFVLALMPPSDARASDWPTPQLLEEMKQKLLAGANKPSPCLPGCASVARVHLEVARDRLTILADIHAGGDIIVPLPGGGEWRPDTVVIVGSEGASVLRGGDGGVLHARLARGAQQVRMSGRLPTNRDTVSIAFPLKAQYMDANAAGWTVQGIRDNGESGDSIQLVFAGERGGGEQEAALEKSKLPAFVQVERTLSFGVTWQVATWVRRLTPAGEALAVDIPLLPGETVTSSDMPVTNGHALVNLAPHAVEKGWVSQLEPRAEFTLSAPRIGDWPANVAGAELWRLNISNLWHVEFSGLPPVQIPGASAAAYTNAGQVVPMPSFQPWPGETLTIRASRPEGVPGRTFTIDGSTLVLTAGERALEAALTLSMRSSQGGQHDVVLPEGAELRGVTINGQDMPLALKGSVATLPLVPGHQTVRLAWNQPHPMSVLYRTPQVNLGTASVNAKTELTLPQNRWILIAFGPQMGPAVLFWSWIPVMLLAALALSASRLTPLGFSQWALLLLGLTQTGLAVNLMVAGWLLALGWRGGQADRPLSAKWFNARQVLLAVWTVAALLNLLDGIRVGLLGSPEMSVEGNGSYGVFLRWYQDIVDGMLPQAGVISLPVLCYRVLMLMWALWLAFALVRWLQWGWRCFTAGGYWRLGQERRSTPSDAP